MIGQPFRQMAIEFGREIVNHVVLFEKILFFVDDLGSEGKNHFQLIARIGLSARLLCW